METAVQQADVDLQHKIDVSLCRTVLGEGTNIQVIKETDQGSQQEDLLHDT